MSACTRGKNEETVLSMAVRHGPVRLTSVKYQVQDFHSKLTRVGEHDRRNGLGHSLDSETVKKSG
jgi:hypothetical protein